MFRIFSRGMLIGESELENRDDGMGVVSGKFHPSEAYASVRAVFQVFADAQPDDALSAADRGEVERYYRLRDELALTVEDGDGQPLANEGVHIEDFVEEGDHLAVEVYGVERGAWYRGRA